VRRDQLEHAIRASCQILSHPAVIIVGSQAILGTFDESDLPTEATMSHEVDVLPMADSSIETSQLADLLDGVAGQWSSFEQLHGFCIDGVDWQTCALPTGWQQRLVRVQNPNTAAPRGQPQFIGWCLDKEDLCVAKLCANREKDLNFVQALISAKLVDPTLIADRLGHLDELHQSAADRARRWLECQWRTDDSST
jgi:hypothetical protein